MGDYSRWTTFLHIYESNTSIMSGSWCHVHLKCRYIDGRVWPERDELEVRLMMDLIRHVTGNKSVHLTPELYCFQASFTASMHLLEIFQLLMQKSDHCMHAGMTDLTHSCTWRRCRKMNLP